MTWPARLNDALAILALAWVACSGPSTIGPGGPCVADSDCTAPDVCVGTGVCGPLPPCECMSDADCSYGFCEGCTCINPGGPGFCTSDSDCSSGETCAVDAGGECVYQCGVGGAGCYATGGAGTGGSGGGAGTGGMGGHTGAGGSGIGAGGAAVDGG